MLAASPRLATGLFEPCSRSGKRRADALQGRVEADERGGRNRRALDHAQCGERAPRRLAIIMHAMLGNGTEFQPA